MFWDIAACFGCFPCCRRSKASTPSTPSSTSLPPPTLSLPADLRQHAHTTDTAHQQNHDPDSQTSLFHEKAQEIAQIPVGGMLRNPGPSQTSCYISSYQPVQNRGPHAPGRSPSNANNQGRMGNVEVDTTDDTLVGSPDDVEKKGAHGQATSKNSTWQGKPNGTAYDRREELTAEDEDMWARLAM